MTALPRIVLLVGCLALFGWGCAKKNPAASDPSTQNQVEAYLPPPASPESEEQIARRELEEIIQRFRDARTFRATLSVQTGTETVSGQIDVMKPDRFRGTLSVPKDGKTETSEVVGVSDTIYIRLAEDVWTYVKNKKQAAALTQAFRSAIDGNASVLSTAIPEAARITKTRDASLGCDRYSTELTDESGDIFTLHVCAAGGFPKRIDILLPEGSATVNYFDFNALFVIERPIGIRPE